MTKNELRNPTDGVVNLITQLNAKKLLTVLEISLAECGPLERALNNYYYAPERQAYNELLDQLELPQYQVLDINTPPTTSPQAIQEAVTARITELRQQARTAIQERQDNFNGDWQNLLKRLEANLPQTAGDNLKNQVRNKLSGSLYQKEPKFRWSCLQGWLLTLAIAGSINFIFFPSFTLWLIKTWLLEPLLILLRLIEAPWDEPEYWIHFAMIHGAGALLALPVAAFIHTKRGIRHDRWAIKQVDKESEQLAKDYYANDSQVLRTYQTKTYADFIADNAVQRLNYRYDFWEWKSPYSELERFVAGQEQILSKLTTCEEQFPNLLDRVFQLDQAYDEAVETWQNRVEAGQSMAMTLPEDYRQSSTLLALHHYLTNGRAENWKEAVNLMHTEAEFAELKSQFDYLNNQIDGLHNDVYQLSTELEYQGMEHRKLLESQANDNFQANRQLAAQLQLQNAQLTDHTDLLNEQNRVMNVMMLTQLLSS